MEQCCRCCINASYYGDGYNWCHAKEKMISHEAAVKENKCKCFRGEVTEKEEEDGTQETLF